MLREKEQYYFPTNRISALYKERRADAVFRRHCLPPHREGNSFPSRDHLIASEIACEHALCEQILP